MSEENKNTSEVQEESVDIPVTEDQPEAETSVEKEESAKEEAAAGENEETEETPETETTSETEDGQPAEEKQEKAKTSFFGKKKKEKDKFEQQIEDLTDRLKRSMSRICQGGNDGHAARCRHLYGEIYIGKRKGLYYVS